MLVFKKGKTIQLSHACIMDPVWSVLAVLRDSLQTVVLRALTHWSVHTNYLCLGWSLNPIFNLHNSISHQSL